MKKSILLLIVLVLSSSAIFAQSLLLKISGKNVKDPSYLLGTIHILYQDSVPIFEKAKALLPHCKTYALEVKMENSLAMLSMVNQMTLPDNKSIQDYLSTEEYISLTQYLNQNAKIPIDFVKKFQPIIIQAFIEMNTLDNKDSTDALYMDIALQSQAKKKKLKVEGLETMNEQMSSLLSIPLEEQVQALKEFIHADSIKLVDLSTSLYMKNDVALLYDYLIKQMSPTEIQNLLDERNERMLARMIPLLADKPTLVAVGAGHLGGENGLINLLRKKGYKVEDVVLE
ncbi:MAG: TraB/GumN family protein [Bacteroidota bacterium]